MKKNIAILAIVVALVAGAVGIGWVYFSLNPEAWDDFVTEMQGETTSSTSPRPVKRAPRKSGGLVASGSIEAEEVTVAAEMGGRVIQVLAGEGDQVEAGIVLVKLDQTGLLAQREQAEAAVSQAQAALDAAGAQLALVEAGARPKEIAIAEGALAGAQAGLDAAKSGHAAAQGQLAAAEAGLAAAEVQLAAARVAQTNAETLVTAAQARLDGAEAQLSAVQAELVAAQAQLRLAQAQMAHLVAGARPDEIAVAEAGLRGAQAALDGARQVYDPVAWQPGIDVSPVGVAYRQAQAAVDAAQAQVNLIKAGATEAELDQVRAAEDMARAAIAAAQAAVEMAQAGVDGAEAQLAQAQAGVDAADVQAAQAQVGVEAAQAAVAIAQAGVDGAQAGIDAAQAQLDQAQASLDLLNAGARNEEILLLEANVSQAKALRSSAQAALQALDIQLDRMKLAAPVGGIVLERTIHAGELAAPGAPLLTLANLDEVMLTVYVPEAELGQVSLGQPVEVTVDAYEDLFTGEVSHIASQAEFTPKNVQTVKERVHMVFAVKVRLDNADHRLKPGMPADAVFK